MTNIIDTVKSLVSEMEADYEKFTSKNNSSAGKRVRVNALAVSKLMKELRAEVQDKKNALKEAK